MLLERLDAGGGGAQWAGLLGRLLSLSSGVLLRRTTVHALSIQHEHLARSVPELRASAVGAQGVRASLAEITLLWLALKNPGAGASAGWSPLPAAAPLRKAIVPEIH